MWLWIIVIHIRFTKDPSSQPAHQSKLRLINGYLHWVVFKNYSYHVSFVLYCRYITVLIIGLLHFCLGSRVHSPPNRTDNVIRILHFLIIISPSIARIAGLLQQVLRRFLVSVKSTLISSLSKLSPVLWSWLHLVCLSFNSIPGWHRPRNRYSHQTDIRKWH